MNDKRKFDIAVAVEQQENSDWNFELSLSSVFKDSEFPLQFKQFESGSKIYSEKEERRIFIQIIYNFLKNNLNVEEEA